MDKVIGEYEFQMENFSNSQKLIKKIEKKSQQKNYLKKNNFYNYLNHLQNNSSKKLNYFLLLFTRISRYPLYLLVINFI